MPHGKMSPEPNFSQAYALSCPDGIRNGVLSSVTPSFDSLTCSLHLQRNSQAPLSPTELCLFALSPSQSHCHLIPVEDLLTWPVSIPGHLSGWGLLVAWATLLRGTQTCSMPSFIQQIRGECLLYPRHCFSCWDKAGNKTDQNPFLHGIYILVVWFLSTR